MTNVAQERLTKSNADSLESVYQVRVIRHVQNQCSPSLIKLHLNVFLFSVFKILNNG